MNAISASCSIPNALGLGVTHLEHPERFCPPRRRRSTARACTPARAAAARNFGDRAASAHDDDEPGFGHRLACQIGVERFGRLGPRVRG